jgi:uncharacterized cupin superfamily protein
VPNINQPDFDDPRELEGFRARRARLGRQTGASLVGASLWEVPPGEAAYPFHWHVAQEEMVIVLEGDMRLRTPEGWREVPEGEVLFFPTGEGGAHQLHNAGEQTVRFLAVANQQPDIVLYPDSGKLGASESGRGAGGVHMAFKTDDAVSYWEGETPPEVE